LCEEKWTFSIVISAWLPVISYKARSNTSWNQYIIVFIYSSCVYFFWKKGLLSFQNSLKEWTLLIFLWIFWMHAY
jgi:hypothetical protein